jgi:hypothetical protein
MADDLGDEWWLNDDENDDLDKQNVENTQQSKLSICVFAWQKL